MVKLNEQFSVVSDGADIAGALQSLCQMLSPDELSQVAVMIEDSKLQVVAPPAIAMKIGHAFGIKTP